MKRMKAVDILKAALKKFGPNGKYWIRESYANNARGGAVDSNSPEACCWCSVGALRAVAGGPEAAGVFKARAALCKVVGGNVLVYNDTFGRQFHEIRKVFKAAIKELEAA